MKVILALFALVASASAFTPSTTRQVVRSLKMSAGTVSLYTFRRVAYVRWTRSPA